MKRLLIATAVALALAGCTHAQATDPAHGTPAPAPLHIGDAAWVPYPVVDPSAPLIGGGAQLPPPPDFFDSYAGAITGNPPPGSYVPGTNPLKVMLGDGNHPYRVGG